MAVLFMERQRKKEHLWGVLSDVCMGQEAAQHCASVCEKRGLFHSATSKIAPCLMHWVNFFSGITNDDKLNILWLEYCLLLDTVLILKLCNMKILFLDPWRVVFNTLLLPNSCCLGRDVITQAFYNFIEHIFMKHKDDVNNCHI